MQTRDRRRVTTSSISLSTALSLTGAGWKCLHQDSWQDHHTEFFRKIGGFCQSTLTRPPSHHHTGRQSAQLSESGNWVIETNESMLVARVALQVLSGDFNHGLLFVDVERDLDDTPLVEPIAQMISLALMTAKLDTLRVIPLSPIARSLARELFPTPQPSIYTFTGDWLPSLVEIDSHSTDRDSWFESSAGGHTLTSLAWLKKRMDRVQAIETMSQKERKRPWLLSVLMLGRRRSTRAPTRHPLDVIRQRQR